MLVAHDAPDGTQPASEWSLSESDQRSSMSSQIWVREAVEATGPRRVLHGHWHVCRLELFSGLMPAELPPATNMSATLRHHWSEATTVDAELRTIETKLLKLRGVVIAVEQSNQHAAVIAQLGFRIWGRLKPSVFPVRLTFVIDRTPTGVEVQMTGEDGGGVYRWYTKWYHESFRLQFRRACALLDSGFLAGEEPASKS